MEQRTWDFGHEEEIGGKLGCQRIVQGILYQVNRSSGASKNLTNSERILGFCGKFQDYCAAMCTPGGWKPERK